MASNLTLDPADLLDTLNEIVFQTNPQGWNWTYLNHPWIRLTGFSVDALPVRLSGVTFEQPTCSNLTGRILGWFVLPQNPSSPMGARVRQIVKSSWRRIRSRAHTEDKIRRHCGGRAAEDEPASIDGAVAGIPLARRLYVASRRPSRRARDRPARHSCRSPLRSGNYWRVSDPDDSDARHRDGLTPARESWCHRDAQCSLKI
jgi:hypothetical protein